MSEAIDSKTKQKIAQTSELVVLAFFAIHKRLDASGQLSAAQCVTVATALSAASVNTLTDVQSGYDAQ